MSTRLLGQGFDIHGGGSDLKFPHHDNEISQARCCTPGAEYARTWLHNGMITVEGYKMSKSIGNVLSVEYLLGRLPGGAIRLALLSSHYRSNLDWSNALEHRNLSAWQKFSDLARSGDPHTPIPERILEALLDDFNTAEVIAQMHALSGQGDCDAIAATLDLLGISIKDDREALPVPLAKKINRLVKLRDQARIARDFHRGDDLRDRLTAAGIILKDGPEGTTWETGADFDAARLPEAD